jgi:Surface lipoprotein assembly modifier
MMGMNLVMKMTRCFLMPLAFVQLAAPAAANGSDSAAVDEVGQDMDGYGSPTVIRPSQDADSKTGTGSARRYSFEVGVLPHYLDNYYQTQDDFGLGAAGGTPQSVGIVTLSGAVNYELVQSATRKVTVGARVRHNIYTDLDHANSTDVDLTLVYDAKPSQLKLGYFGSRHRLVSDAGGSLVYGATNGASADYSYRFTKRLRGRVGYRFTRQTYSSSTSRNLSEHNFSADLRYQVVRQFMPSVGVEYSRGNASSSAYSFKRKAVYVGFTSELGDLAYLNFRYRRSQRDYLTSVPTDSYFGREDPRDDLSLYGSVQLGGGFSLFGFATHINNRSNQPSHKFTSNEAGAGLFFRF